MDIWQKVRLALGTTFLEVQMEDINLSMMVLLTLERPNVSSPCEVCCREASVEPLGMKYHSSMKSNSSR